MKHLALLLALSSLAAGQDSRFSEIVMPEGEVLFHAARMDVNADGRPDALLQTARRGEDPTRFVRVHLAQAEGAEFRESPDRVVELASWDTGYLALAARPGGPRRLYSVNRLGVVPLDTEARVLRTVVDAEFLFQVPETWRALPLAHLVRDLDGDGRDDLVLPEPGRLRLALQDPPAEAQEANGTEEREELPGFSRQFVLDPPRTLDDLRRAKELRTGMLSRRGDSAEFRVSFGPGSEDSGPLVDFEDAVNVPVFADYDGDGHDDVFLRTPTRLHVWTRREDGGFDEEPTRSLPLPVREDRDLAFDVSWSALVRDLDGDGRADVVLASSHVHGEGALVQIFGTAWEGPLAPTPDHPIFGPEGVPRQVVPISRPVAGLRAVDVDGDGRADLTLSSFEAKERAFFGDGDDGIVNVRFLVFRNLGGTVSKRADVAVDLELAIDRVREIDEEVGVTAFVDLNGDLVRELLVRTGPSRFEIRASRRTGPEAFGYADEALRALEWEGEGEPLVFDERDGGPPSVWVLTEKGMRCWSF